MIASLAGQIIHKSNRAVVLETAGVGYLVFVLPTALKTLAVGQPGRLWISQIIREDTSDLYGFAERAELELFEHLISVSGVGPKTALAILALAPPATLVKAIGSGNIEYLTRVSGIGQKVGQKIILELRDKLGAIGADGAEELTGEADALDALRALGYSPKEAREALQRVANSSSDPGEKVKAALKFLSQQ